MFQTWSIYSFYFALRNVPALWVVSNLSLPASIPAGSQNLEGLERETQKQNWKHRDKNRSSQVRLFRRGSNCGLVEELIEWTKVGQCANE